MQVKIKYKKFEKFENFFYLFFKSPDLITEETSNFESEVCFLKYFFLNEFVFSL